MKAIRFHQHGGPEVLRLDEVDAPRPGPGTVSVHLKYAALNRLDLFTRTGHPSLKIALPHITGADGSGVVAEPGAEVSGWQPGDRVLISPGISCGRCAECLSGRDNLCRAYGVIGNRSSGTYCETVVVPAANLAPIPGELSFAEAAAAPLVFLTAWHMLVGRAKIRPGETVLVQAAGSGVGMAAIQVARLFHSRVIATAGSQEKLDRARGLGAHECVNYRTQDFAEEVARLTARRGVDIVVEHVGGEVFEKSIPCLARGGRLVTCGNTLGPVAQLSTAHVFGRHLDVLGSYMGTKAELLELLPFLGSGQLKAVVDSEYPLEQAEQAHRRLEGRENFGKILLKIAQ